ncbi:hypothetical protein CC78DRAFT_574051 [Lojkania enalia]|uniref:Uncharacterized protein n=1 Tax=Lojkania enalia TaxID=147567 RepID=A0A9P4TRT3_9PLEO|nr:hypothetical protein CC78DRAFT_574051 [Didymosphaeria enalia]
MPSGRDSSCAGMEVIVRQAFPRDRWRSDLRQGTATGYNQARCSWSTSCSPTSLDSASFLLGWRPAVADQRVIVQHADRRATCVSRDVSSMRGFGGDCSHRRRRSGLDLLAHVPPYVPASIIGKLSPPCTWLPQDLRLRVFIHNVKIHIAYTWTPNQAFCSSKRQQVSNWHTAPDIVDLFIILVQPQLASGAHSLVSHPHAQVLPLEAGTVTQC